MTLKVIGAGMMFLGMGCGPALTAEQRAYLKDIKPEEFYPLDKLLAMLRQTEEENPKLVYANGRRWGAAVKGEMDKAGISDIMQALQEVPKIYLQHHQGDVGTITLEPQGDTAVLLTNKGLYPHYLIGGAFEALAVALGGQDVTLEPTGEAGQFRVSWTMET